MRGLTANNLINMQKNKGSALLFGLIVVVAVALGAIYISKTFSRSSERSPSQDKQTAEVAAVIPAPLDSSDASIEKDMAGLDANLKDLSVEVKGVDSAMNDKPAVIQ